MSNESPWFRQDCAELTSDWLFFLSPGARWAWVMLKSYIKGSAASQKAPNRAARLSPKVAALQWNVTPADIEEVEAAAIKAGTLTIEGTVWVFTDRLAFQSERTAQRYTPSQPTTNEHEQMADTGGDTEDLSDKRRQTPTPCRATETETRTYIDANASTGGGSDGREPNHVWDPIARVICQAAESCGWPIPTNDQLKTDVARYLKPGSAIAQLINAYGEDGAVERFVWIHEHWSVSASWELAWSKRNQVDDEMLGRRVIATRAPTRKASSSNTLETYNALLEGSEIWKAQQQAA